jgi:hypothetical protein
MSDDFSSVTEVTTTGWLQRLLGSFVAALIGILLIIGGVALLWWNESRAVTAIRALDQGAHQVVEVAADAVDPAAQGRLVHLSGMMQAGTPTRDAALGVGGAGLLRLKRTVEMYAWVESKETQTHKNLGGSETKETTYTYSKEWMAQPTDSAHFHAPTDHRNPPMPLSSTTIDAGGVTLGAWHVDPGLLAEVAAFAPFSLADAAPPAGYRKLGDSFYRGQDSDNPAIGDIRVSYQGVPAQTMSVVAAASSETLAPFSAANGYRIALAHAGVEPAAEMFREKRQSESVLTWVLRGVGFLVMLFGFMLTANPLAVLVGVIPFLEGLAEFGIFLLALFIAVPATFFVVALAWLVYRPLIGAALIAAGLGFGYLIRRLHRAPPRPAPAAR